MLKLIDQEEPPDTYIGACIPEREADWLVEGPIRDGVQLWYVRIECAGFFPRRYGAFTQKDAAEEFYMKALHRLAAELMCEIPQEITEHNLEVYVEDELGGAYRALGKVQR